jgi:hypothetical protein
MAEAARQAIGADSFNVVADAGYSNGEQVAHCEEGMIPHVAVKRTVNNQGDGSLFGRQHFHYEPDSDTYVCPGNKRLLRKNTIIKIVTSCTGLRHSTVAPARSSHVAPRLRDAA